MEYCMTSHLFVGVWCSSSSIYALRKAVDSSSASELIRETVYEGFYVDDMLKSVKSTDEACKVVFGTKKSLTMGGFNLTKFVVNDPEVLNEIPPGDRASEVKDIGSDMQEKAFGIKWDVKDDSLYHVSKQFQMDDKFTKCILLSQLSSVYDPLGLLSPIIICGRMLFQDVSRLKLSWDDELLSELSAKWFKWLKSLEHVPSLRFPWNIIPKGFVDGVMELHNLCDASEKGYGACCYLRTMDHKGNVEVCLVASKVRLAPIKKVTITRLELMSAVIAAKLD